MTVRQLMQLVADTLQPLVGKVVGTKVYQWGLFHNEVRKLLNPVLKKYGLYYSTSWGIQLISTEDRILAHDDIWVVDINLKNNARYSGKVGKILSIGCKWISEYEHLQFPNVDFTHYIDLLRSAKISQRVREIEASIKERELSIKQSKNSIVELKALKPLYERAAKSNL